MKLSYFLLLVAAISILCSANFANAEAIAKLRDQDTNAKVAEDVTHRNLKGSKKTTTEGTVAISEERLALPSVKNAVSKLKSIFSKNPDLTKTLKQTTPGVGINLQNPAIRKEMKIVGALLAFIIGTPLLAVGISRITA
ncbi:hypothetical protein KRP22_011556 [Phytophthora ramorum]|nr:hypothetical protein KRP22_10761 [Phytophthora ramorum]